MSDMIMTTVVGVVTGTVVFIIQNAIRERQAKKNNVVEHEIEQKQEIDNIKDGIKALLHDKILQKCEHYLSNGCISMHELEELRYLNRPYMALGGNGTVKIAMEKVEELFIKGGNHHGNMEND